MERRFGFLEKHIRFYNRIQKLLVKQKTKAVVDILILDTIWDELPKCYDDCSIDFYREKYMSMYIHVIKKLRKILHIKKGYFYDKNSRPDHCG